MADLPIAFCASEANSVPKSFKMRRSRTPKPNALWNEQIREIPGGGDPDRHYMNRASIALFGKSIAHGPERDGTGAAFAFGADLNSSEMLQLQEGPRLKSES